MAGFSVYFVCAVVIKRKLFIPDTFMYSSVFWSDS